MSVLNKLQMRLTKFYSNKKCNRNDMINLITAFEEYINELKYELKKYKISEKYPLDSHNHRKRTVRLLARDAYSIAKKYYKEDEIRNYDVDKKEEYSIISLTGSLQIIKMYMTETKQKTVMHNYYLRGSKKDVQDELEGTCGRIERLPRGCNFLLPLYM